MPPLIGASASQSLMLFRNISRRGAVLVSYEYRGHPRSTGTFELDDTLIDTRYAIRWASEYARERGLPMHAVTVCYGLVSLLAAQFKKGQANKATPAELDFPSPFWSINAVSGLFTLDQIIRFEDFAPLFGQKLGRELDRESFLAGIDEGIYDWSGDAFRDAMQEFLKDLFPVIDIGRDYFAELNYDRVDISKTLKQLLNADYLENIEVPPEIPCNFFFGQHDDLLQVNTLEGQERYFKIMRSVVPHAISHMADVDHNGFGPDRNPIVDGIADLCEEAEAKAVPLGIRIDSQEADTGPLTHRNTQHELNR
ncbi:MAG: hypothetical protein PVH19_09030 [Planctomycetia bacterium]